MTAPRCLLAGSTYLVTRRTAFRMFLLTPSEQVNEAVRYCLAYAARQTGVIVHSITVLSNHYHLICTDGRARLPEFTQLFHKLLSSSLNAFYERRENLWAAGIEPSYVRLEDSDAVLAASVYALANPTAAGLVPRGQDWPGVRLFQPRSYRCTRPGFYFSDNMPERLDLVLTSAPLGASRRAATGVLARAVRAEEAAIRRRFKAEGRSFLGARRVLAQHHLDMPSSREERRDISPRVACRDRWRRREILQLAREWRRAYRAALERWRAGEREVVFPLGTYRMRVLHGACCVSAES